MTQVIDLLLLDPRIQEELLHLPPLERGRDPITLRELRYVCQTPVWTEQRSRWAELRATFTPEANQRPQQPELKLRPVSVRRG